MKHILLYATYIWCAGFIVIVALSIAKYIRRRKREKREATEKWKQHLEGY